MPPKDPMFVYQKDAHSSQFTVHSSQFTVHSSQFTVLSFQFSVLSSQFSILSSQFSVLSSQFSVLSSQFSVLSSQFSILSSQFTVSRSGKCKSTLLFILRTPLLPRMNDRGTNYWVEATLWSDSHTLSPSTSLASSLRIPERWAV